MDSLKAYFDSLIQSIRQNSWVVQEELSFKQIDEKSSYIRNELYLNGGFVLHMAEFISFTDKQLVSEKNRYHLQDGSQQQIVRWDNAPHHPEVQQTFPEHRHGSDNRAEPCEPITLPLVLKRLEVVLKDL